MKCPYAVDRTVIVGVSAIIDDTGRDVGNIQIQTNIASFVDCLQSDCGAWDKEHSKCVYAGTQ